MVELPSELGPKVAGDQVDVTERGDEIVISSGRSKLTLEQLVAGITEENRHDETDWGPPVGNEVW